MLADGRRAFVKRSGISTPARPASTAPRPGSPPRCPRAPRRRGWQEYAAADASALEHLAALAPWAARNLARCADLEGNWADAVRGDCLAHGDIRADNVLLSADRVMFVDWPWACLAPPWFDLVGMLPSVAMQGGPAPETILAAHPLGQAADPDAVTAVVARLAGFFLWKGSQPAPPGLPTLRDFQRAQGLVALDWLRQRTGWR